jgi:hypothetical protein
MPPPTPHRTETKKSEADQPRVEGSGTPEDGGVKSWRFVSRCIRRAEGVGEEKAVEHAVVVLEAANDKAREPGWIV